MQLNLLKNLARFLPSKQDQKALTFQDLFGTMATAAGASVTPGTAIAVPAVAAAVSLISGSCATLPAKVFLDDKGINLPDPSHPAFKLIHRDANAWTSASDFRASLTTDALLHGNGYAFVNRINGRPFELIRLDPQSVTIYVDAITGEPSYTVNFTSGGSRSYPWQDILHLPAPGPAPLKTPYAVGGVSPINYAREAIGLALVLEKHGSQLFSRGGKPSGILSFENKLGFEAAKRISESWHAAHAGDNAGRTAVLEEGGRFTPLTFSSVDLQFLEIRRFQILEIARAFRVPPQFLYDLDRATWSNAESQNQEFLTFSLMPWLKAWESAYERCLLTEEERNSYCVQFETDGLLRADTAARASAYASLRAAGVISANEIRAKENLPPHPEGDSLINPYVVSASNAQPQDKISA